MHGVAVMAGAVEAAKLSQLPRYQCHKQVRAAKIFSIERQPEGAILILQNEQLGLIPVDVDLGWMDKHEPQVGGYFVLYDDGYQSYSPAEAFESGYTRMTESAVETDRLLKRVGEGSEPLHELPPNHYAQHTDAERLEWLRRNWESQEFGETCDMASPASIDAFRSVIDGLIDDGHLT